MNTVSPFADDGKRPIPSPLPALPRNSVTVRALGRELQDAVRLRQMLGECDDPKLILDTIEHSDATRRDFVIDRRAGELGAGGLCGLLVGRGRRRCRCGLDGTAGDSEHEDCHHDSFHHALLVVIHSMRAAIHHHTRPEK